MYDELIKRLRERSVFLFPHHGESRSYDADLMHEAADAIEELQGNGSVKYVPVVVDTKPKPITNADRIRAMGDEELAKHLVCEHTICTREKMDCNACMLDWLREEVTDG